MKTRVSNTPSASAPSARPAILHEFAWIAGFLAVVLLILFWDCVLPGHTVASNDGPLGAISSRCADLPSGLFGFWQDLNWLGGQGTAAIPNISTALNILCGKLVFSKVFAPFAIFFVGVCAWFCFRQWKYAPLACVLGGLAASLNSVYFSTACWGVASQPLAFGLNFLALAALADQAGPKRWVRLVLAGMAVGMGVMEAYDIGALFSLAVAGFVVFQAFNSEGALPQKLVRGLSRVALVAVFAAFIATAALMTLIGTQIKGIAGMEQDAATKAQRWDVATQWSFPKSETLGLVVPGLFGFRMDTPKDMAAFGDSFVGGAYWGKVGRDPAWDRYFASGKQGPAPRGSLRFNGGGCYSGLLVVLVAAWTVLQSFRKELSPFAAGQRRFIWFWSVLGFVSLLLAYGRFAPFYQLFYALPYASMIRNPGKFMHLFEWSLLILFACGLDGLSRRCLSAAGAPPMDLSGQLKSWWAKASNFDRKWVKGSAIALGVCLLGWLIYASSRDRLVGYLQQEGIEATMANLTAKFSIRQVGWFILMLVVTLGLFTVTLSGYFSHLRSKLGGILLGALLVVDLASANLPWVISVDYRQKLASNEVLDFLRQKPYEHRVAGLPFPVPQQFELFNSLYEIEWKQHQFQYYNIQSLDIVQMPRQSVSYIAFETALHPGTNSLSRITRRWELTNTRYLLGPAPFLDALNQQIDPTLRRFRTVLKFEIVPKPGIANPTKLEEMTVATKPDGRYALFEFTGALPRARLYTNWQVVTNDQATLTELAAPNFDPAQTVLLAEAPAAKVGPGGATNSSPETVEFLSYAPKHIVLQAKAGTTSVLLYNDRFDPDWRVFVDGQRQPMLRCNYLMRGVQVPAGDHRIEFRFEPGISGLYVSSAAILLGLLLIGFLAVPKPADGLSPKTGPPREPVKPQPEGAKK